MHSLSVFIKSLWQSHRKICLSVFFIISMSCGITMYNQPSSPVPESVKNLIQEYDELYGTFTYAHPDNPEKYNGLQVGLVAIFYLDKSWEKRQAIADVLGDFHHHFGEHLKYGYFRDPNYFESFKQLSLQDREQQIIGAQPDASIEFAWGDNPNGSYVNNYQIAAYSDSKWKEELYNSIGFVSLYLPIDELTEQGLEPFINYMKTIAEKLQPMHGVVGLGIQQTFEWEEYQHIEFKMAQQFRGLDVSNGNMDEKSRNGFKAVNWLMILGDKLLQDKLGSQSELEKHNQDSAVCFYPYNGGVIVRAGAVPALGYIEHDPNPIHYVNANKLLLNARAPKIDSLGYGSVIGERRFNNRTTAEWQSRFDNVEVTDSALSLSTPKN